MSADPQVWRQALPVDPSLGEYPRPARSARPCSPGSCPSRDKTGSLPPIQTPSVSETPPTPLGRAGQALKRLVFGPPLDASAIAVERMRKLVALSVLSDALSSVAAGSTAMTGIEAISNAVPAFEPVEALRMLPGPAGYA